MSQPSTTHAVWHGEQLSLQQSPPSSLVTVGPVLSVHPLCCNTMLLSMIDSLHSQQAQPCLAHRHTQSWPTRDSFRTLASITDTMTTADLLSKGVLRTSSFTKTKDSSNVSAPTTSMQKPALQPDKGTEALQPHCPEQNATELKSSKGKHPFYAHLMSIIDVHTFLTSIRIAEAQGVNDAQCIAHLLYMLMCVFYYPVLAFMGSLPRVASRDNILTFTITDLHLLDAQCHTCRMAQCNDLLQPMSITSTASQTAAAPAASTAVTTAIVTRAAVTTSATASGAWW